MRPSATPHLLLALVLLALLSGCASRTVPFTHELRVQNELTTSDLQNLQFYVSHEIKLRREVEVGSRRISGGKLKVLSGKNVEEVVLEEKTPGVVVAVDEHALAVSFAEGSQLSFSLRGAAPQPLKVEPRRPSDFAEGPDPFPGERWRSKKRRRTPVKDTLLGNYWLSVASDGAQVEFQGKLFEAVKDSFRAHLLIDRESLDEVVEERTVLGGRTLGAARPALRGTAPRVTLQL